MCSVCLSSPCSSRCPNADEPAVVHRCINCKDEIVEGDDYYDIDGEPWCEYCIRKCQKVAEVEE